MLPITFFDDDSNIGPPARFASDAEIEFADHLLRALEPRYLAPCAPASSLRAAVPEGERPDSQAKALMFARGHGCQGSYSEYRWRSPGRSDAPRRFMPHFER